MQVHHSLVNSEQYRGGFLTIGNFDGVHLGHRAILSRVVEQARLAGTVSTLLTFEPHPIQLLRPHLLPPRLTSLDEKIRLILSAGIDHVIVYPTNFELLNLTAEDFFDQIVVKHFQAQGLVEGPNFFFGKDRSGNIDTLQDLCHRKRISLEILAPSLLGRIMISSSEIRRSLEQGSVQTAAGQLGRRYSLEGLVAQGDQRGRTLGFPTANLTDIETLIPANGVYAAVTSLGGRTIPVAVNIGPNPTFGIEARKIEAHLLDFEGNLYGQRLRLEFIDQVRDVQTFVGAQSLQEQIRKDLQIIRERVDTNG